MAKDRKPAQHRSKGERMKWSPVAKDSGKFIARDAMTGRSLAASSGRDRDQQDARNGVKQLVP